MSKYIFKGDYPETFLDLGKELQPGETVVTELILNHPRLQVLEENKKTTKAEVDN